MELRISPFEETEKVEAVIVPEAEKEVATVATAVVIKQITLEDVIREFDSKIITAIKKFNLRTSDPEDIRGDIYLRMIRSHYIERYDPSKSTIATYVYRFVKNFCIKALNHERTVAGAALANALSVQECAEEEGTRGVLMLELFDQKLGDDTERSYFVERLMKELDKPEYSGFSSSGPSGEPRSVKNMVLYLLKGHSVSEIASDDIMGTSTTFIRKKLKELEKIEWLKEYSLGF